MTVPKLFLLVPSPGELLRVRVRRMERDKVPGNRSASCLHTGPRLRPRWGMSESLLRAGWERQALIQIKE